MPEMDESVHHTPLVNRIIEELMRKWLDARTSSALATVGDINDYERGFRAGVEQMRYLHLDNYHAILVPRIVEHLERAGLLVRK